MQILIVQYKKYKNTKMDKISINENLLIQLWLECLEEYWHDFDVQVK